MTSRPLENSALSSQQPGIRLLLAAVGAMVICTFTVACTESSTEPGWAAQTLNSYPNPFGPDDSAWSAQPAREKPQEVLVAAGKAYVSLPGTADSPGRHVAVVDIATQSLLGRIEVGASPVGLALHPNGRLLIVLNRFSNFATVIDTKTDTVIQTLPMDYYAIEALFSADGKRLYVTNRWRDNLQVFDVRRTPEGLRLERVGQLAVGSNPRDLALNADGRRLAVAALTGLTISLVDTERLTEVKRISVGAPISDVAFVGRWLIAATLSSSTHHEPFAGPDTNHDGVPGDGTPNVNFQDLQNELAVFDGQTGARGARYTSDTICCKDFRDVSPEDAARHGDLLPDPSTWIVGGALPEQLLAREDSVYVSYSGSNELQRFDVNVQDGTLSAGRIWKAAGHNPHGLAWAGDTLLVTHRLGETLGFFDVEAGHSVGVVEVGNLSAGPFPATDAEIGELFNFVTATFSVDGDQTCAHCHREGGNIDKAFSMPLTAYPGVGLRMTMAYRGAADTRPWFFESAMDETNFRPVMNEFARIENFCCSDYTLWPDGAPAGCAASPPSACADADNAASDDGFTARRDERLFHHPRPTLAASRDAFYRDAAERLIGRSDSFGDGLYFEDPITGARSPIALDFEGLTRALGLFLMTAPRLLPNPNDLKSQSVRRGKALFESPSTGCIGCHPPPTFAVSTDVNPFGMPLQMGPVVSPTRGADGTNLDLFAEGFVAAFPRAQMDSCVRVCDETACAESPRTCDDVRDVRFGVPSLRGLWDRAPSMLHDGRAQSLREVLLTPGHPALRGAEVGYNERDGVPDSHGGTSHLAPSQIDDLEAYLLTL